MKSLGSALLIFQIKTLTMLLHKYLYRNLKKYNSHVLMNRNTFINKLLMHSFANLVVHLKRIVLRIQLKLFDHDPNQVYL